MKNHDRVSVEGVASSEDENLFNRASNRMHGYSSRLSRYLRLSIGLRASASYSLLLLQLSFTFAFLLILLYGFLQAPNYLTKQQKALMVSPPATVEGVQILRLPLDAEPDGIVIYDGWGIHLQEEPFRLRLQYVTTTSDKQIQMLFALEEDWRVLKGLLMGLAGLIAIAIFTFMTRGKRVNRKLLQPINQITATAQQMSEKNLSARINVAGTQNELRDLAVVINDMLNRIEAAYNRQKQFVSDASHELRTPIAVIQGYAGLLERWGKDNPDVRDEAIEAIASETQSMKELVENLLFLARHDKKTLTLSYEPFDSAEMLHELIKETAIIATEHHILTGEVAQITVVGDRSTIKQAVRVFVDNAIKYTPTDGSIEIASKINKKTLQITVSDSGPGIKKADLARIFDRFYRTDEVRNSQVNGHGLGLSIARIIAASHGGRIHAQSRIGVGSAFTLEIPLDARENKSL